MYLKHLIALRDKAINIFFVTVLTLVNLQAKAQIGGPPTDPGQGDCDVPGAGGPDAPCPLDTWVYVLVIAALLIGAYRLHRIRSNFS